MTERTSRTRRHAVNATVVDHASGQAEVIAAWREQSNTDRRTRLGLPLPQTRPEFGPSVGAYFAAKHAAGRFGKYWPLHQTARGQDRG
jgi:hypothetical protein